MTVNVPARPPTTDLTGRLSGPVRPRTPTARPERGSSPREGARIRSLPRGRIEDRLQELGDLYAETSGGDPWAWNQARSAFLRRLAADARRPGFELLIAETTALTGCAYGFPARRDGPRWEGFGGYVPGTLLRLAEAGRLFVVCEIVVPPRVRSQNQSRPWNLARRMQRRLLTDHGATCGVTLVNRFGDETVRALRSWGWRYLEGDSARTAPLGPFRLLVLGS